MARPKKSSKRVDKPRNSRPLRELKEDLGLDEPDWEEFLRHALDGFTDYENAYDPGHDNGLRLSEVPDEWFEDVQPLAHVTLRVLKDARPEIAARVAYYFVQLALAEPGELRVPPGLGASWLYVDRQGVESPVEDRQLAHVALHVPEAFFRGVDDDDMVPLCRLVLDAIKPIDVWDLHAVLGAVDRARQQGRAIYGVFKDMMSSDQITAEDKKELCRGILECPDAVERMTERAEAIRAVIATKQGWASTPLSYAMTNDPSFYAIHGGLKRHAVVALVENAGERLREVIDAHFMKPHFVQSNEIAMSEGVVDLIRAAGDELDEDTVKKLLSRAIKAGLGPVRVAAYRAGAERFGPDYARPALKDSARMVRDWAKKYLAPAKPKRGSRPRTAPEKEL